MSLKENRAFYVGWQDKMDPAISKFLRNIVFGIFAILLVLVALVVYIQRPFNNYQFLYGNQQEFTGIYYHHPVPMLLVDPGALPDSLSRQILLVGYGKYGGAGIMEDLETQHGELNLRTITLRGTLIFGNGKTLLELTEKENSMVALLEGKGEKPFAAPAVPISLSGEILDPKCYFGVMKPGEGKVHKSCAIRCISGGIPPVYRSRSALDENKFEYYILLGADGQSINEDILEFVADRTLVSGMTTQVLDWKVLYVDVNKISRN